MSELTNIFTDIATAIRSKLSTSSAFTPAQMIDKIKEIPTCMNYIEPYKYMYSNINNYSGDEELILDGGFLTCMNLTTVSFPQCTKILTSAFCNCSNLNTVSFPKCTELYLQAFFGCGKLTTVSFPECTLIDGYAFRRCYQLATVSFPKCSSIGSFAFADCSALTTISFPKCTYIGASTFYNCTALNSLYLLTTAVPSLSTSNAFNLTPLSAGGTGKIYVKSSMVNAFKTATNWSYLSARIVGM